MVDLVPNRDNYEDVYPEESDDGDSDSTDDAPDPSENEPSFSKARAQEKQNNEKLTKQANEEKNSALGQLAMLEKYAKSIENCRPKDLENCITLYREQRERVFHGHFASEAKLKDLQKEHDKIEKKYNKAWKAFKRESEGDQKAAEGTREEASYTSGEVHCSRPTQTRTDQILASKSIPNHSKP